MSRNAEISELLEEFADLLEAQDVEYKPRAYRRAAENVLDHPAAIEALVAEGPDAVTEIEGVGEAIGEKIIEYIETGSIDELEALRAELPVAMDELTSVEGVGPKTVGTLYEELGVTDLSELETAASEGRIREVSGFGPKTEENILENIPFARQASERTLLGTARPLADDVLEFVSDLPAVTACDTAGSIRRWCETVGDVDILVASTDTADLEADIRGWDRVDTVIEAGENKASVRIANMRVDFRFVAPEEFGSALQYFTGGKDHNVRLRNLAIDRDLKMNEYGVFEVDSSRVDDGPRSGTRIAGETESSMYDALDLEWIPPELREDTGEIIAAADGTLPTLVTADEVRGDLHVHTDWSDGSDSLATIVAGAAEFGHEYICIADHATGPGMVGGVGVSDDDLEAQIDEIRAVDADAPIDVLAGVEANIDSTGGISVRDSLLERFDLVTASPHSELRMDGEAATERLIEAASHPSVDVIGHPTGRLLNRRPGMDIDIGAVARAAAEAGTALEINSNPYRLDLWGRAVKTAIEAGATIVINTDAHGVEEFRWLRYGVHTARRGWAEREDILNTQSSDAVLAFAT